MIIKAQVEKAEAMKLPGRTKDEPESTLWSISLSDKTRPAAFRCSEHFQLFLSDEKYTALLSGRSDLIDERVTLVLQGQSVNKQGNIKNKGMLIDGWPTPQQLEALAAPETAPVSMTIERPGAPDLPSGKTKGDIKPA
jgi:hypothetical protein